MELSGRGERARPAFLDTGRRVAMAARQVEEPGDTSPSLRLDLLEGLGDCDDLFAAFVVLEGKSPRAPVAREVDALRLVSDDSLHQVVHRS